MVRFPELCNAVCVSAVGRVLAVAGLLKELAHLRLVVVVGQLHHLVLHFKGQFIVPPAQLFLTVCEVAACSLDASSSLHKVAAKGRFVEYV